jgi:type III secretory pathway component EscU
MCEDNDVPIRDVMYFIDIRKFCQTIGVVVSADSGLMQSGNIFFMLIDLKITLIKLCKGNRAKKMQELKDALESKDFKVIVILLILCYSRLTWTGRMGYITICLHVCCCQISQHMLLILSII